MIRFLLDSNILILSLASLSPFYRATQETLRRLGDRGAVFLIAQQSLYEFWVLATRPESDGGLGFSPARAREEIGLFLERFRLVDDSIVTWSDVLDLAVEAGVIGRRIHDARLVAVMRAHGVRDILSFDRDMDAFPGITRHAPTA